MKKRTMALFLAAAMAAGAIGGCSKTAETGTGAAAAETGKKEETGKTAEGEGEEKITLRFAWWGGDERNTATLDVIDQFEKLHPNVTIEAEYGGNDGYHDKLATQLASRTAADIVQVDPEIFPTYVATGDYFIDFKEYGMDMGDFEESYLSLPINGRYNGKQLGLPSGISGAGILVNKDLADAAGLDFTKKYDWDDLLEMGRKVREYDDSMYLLCANKEYITNLVVFNYAKQLIGTTLFDPESKSMNMTEDQLKQVFDYVEKLYDEGVVAPASYQASYSGDNLQSDANWIAGKYVAALTYVSTIDVMAAANPDANYHMSELPALEGSKEAGWASNTPQVFAVTSTSQHPEMAVEFMNYFFNDDTAIETLGCTRSVPPTEKARKICADKGLLSEWTMEGANIAAAMGGTPNDKISSSQESKAILFDSVETIGYGASDPATVAADAVSLLSGLSDQ
ncbi:extracellular solute-binding protein [Lachnospiraceae bacterium 54-53]